MTTVELVRLMFFFHTLKSFAGELEDAMKKAIKGEVETDGGKAAASLRESIGIIVNNSNKMLQLLDEIEARNTEERNPEK